MTEATKGTLRECPFCGAAHTRGFGSDGGRHDNEWYELCGNCGARGPVVPGWRETEGAWNTRPVEDALRAQVAEMAAQVEMHRAIAETYRMSILEIDAERDALIARLQSVTHWVAEAHSVMVHNESALLHGEELLDLPEPPSMPRVSPPSNRMAELEAQWASVPWEEIVMACRDNISGDLPRGRYPVTVLEWVETHAPHALPQEPEDD